MVLSEYAQTHAGFHFNMLATDICTAVLAKARQGIFKSEAAAPVPAELRRKYCMRSREPGSELLRIVPGAARASGIPARQLHGLRLWRQRAARNYFLPERHYLF